MPLKSGKSKAVVQSNIKKEIASGKKHPKPLPSPTLKLETQSQDAARKSKD